MIRLDRTKVAVPGTWQDSVRGAFPDYGSFQSVAAVFEALSVDDPVRRKGFRSYACHVLHPAKGKKGNFKPIWGEAKEALAEMAHYKCAYCESPIAAESTGEVEHFKPKALFPLLAYEWANYFLGCGGCNRAKLSKWPAGGREYVRPDEGDPPSWFVFRESGRVEAAAAGEAGELTLRDFKMNRRWLQKQRALRIKEALDELHIALKDPAITPEGRGRLARGVIDKYRSSDKAYSAAVMQCLRRFWERECPGMPFGGPFSGLI